MLETEPAVRHGTDDRSLVATRGLAGQLHAYRVVFAAAAAAQSPVGPDATIHRHPAVRTAPAIRLDGNRLGSALGDAPIHAPATLADQSAFTSMGRQSHDETSLLDPANNPH